MVGQRIGNYQIIERLGEGGMASVYLALHPELGRRVAVKVLNLDLARSAEMVQRFFNEARAASGIGHRGIVEVSDLGTLPSGAPYLVMEFLEGESLADRMTRTGPLPLTEAAEIAGQAASVMAAAHAGGIIHRDLKPENLYLVPDPLLPGRSLVKVLDFGIAKLAQRPLPESRGDLRTRTGAILGTPRYMSPEQCRESRDVDHRADVYSLGVVLYEMLAGTPPFASGSWGELAHMHIGVEPPALRTHVPEIPVEVAEVVHRALQKDPAARFQSMAEFGDALEAALAVPSELPLPTAAIPGRTGAPVAVRDQVTTPGLGPTADPGSTRLLETPAGLPPRSRRKTTLEEAASEITRHPSNARRAVPLALSLAAAAVVILIGVVVLRPEATTSDPPAPAPAASAAPAPAPSTLVPPARTAPPLPLPPPEPPPPIVPAAPPIVPAAPPIVPAAPPVVQAAPPPGPSDEPAVAPPPPPQQAHRRRRAPAPTPSVKPQKDAAASAPRPASPHPPREPLKI